MLEKDGEFLFGGGLTDGEGIHDLSDGMERVV
jgi:hypothetical protein